MIAAIAKIIANGTIIQVASSGIWGDAVELEGEPGDWAGDSDAWIVEEVDVKGVVVGEFEDD